MKKILAVVLAASMILGGCAEEKKIGVNTYVPFGLADQAENRNPNIKYRIDVPNVICAIIFSETIIVPIYVVGWALWEPVSANDPTVEPGVKI